MRIANVERTAMNEYEFYYEINKSGWFSTYNTCAANTLTAYENFIVYLRKCNIDPATVEVLDLGIGECDDNEEEE